MYEDKLFFVLFVAFKGRRRRYSAMNSFNDCVKFVQQLPPNDGRIDQSTRLLLYGLYKVATQGRPPEKPPKTGITESYKHQAWVDAAVTCFSQEHAKAEYVVVLNELIAKFG